MINEAIRKLTDEMNKNSNGFVQMVGDKLIQLCDGNEYLAEKIMQDGKTVAGAMEYMRTAAEKKKNGNLAVIDPEEGYNLIMEYYRVEGMEARMEFHQQSQKKYSAPAEGKLIDILDFM